MRKAILLMIFVFALNAFADQKCDESVSAEEATGFLNIDTSTPAWLKGATITIRRADGKETTVPAEKFKVVPRKQQFVVTKTQVSKVTTCSAAPLKNRLSALGGRGAQGGLKTTSTPTTVEVESKTGFVGGAQYQRLLNDRISVGVQGQTNDTGSLLIGVDF